MQHSLGALDNAAGVTSHTATGRIVCKRDAASGPVVWGVFEFKATDPGLSREQGGTAPLWRASPQHWPDRNLDVASFEVGGLLHLKNAGQESTCPRAATRPVEFIGLCGAGPRHAPPCHDSVWPPISVGDALQQPEFESIRSHFGDVIIRLLDLRVKSVGESALLKAETVNGQAPRTETLRKGKSGLGDGRESGGRERRQFSFKSGLEEGRELRTEIGRSEIGVTRAH